jgi:NitT/TauT family transport system substrate-binding protein
MRVFLKTVPLAVALLCASLPASAELQKIKMTVTSVAAPSAPYFIAIDKGYFAAQGLAVEIVSAGGGVAIPALISGSVDFSMSAAVSVGASMRGAALRVVYTMADRPAYQLWTIDPAIKTLADMKGKQVGIISRGDTFEIALRIMLRDAGLPLDYVGFTALGPGNSPRQAALAAGSLPAVIITAGDVAAFRNNPVYAKAHLLADMEKAIRMPYTGIATTARHIQQDRALVKRFLHAMVQGVLYMRAFKDETVAVLAKTDPTVSRTVFAADWDDLMPTLTADGTAPDALIEKDLEVRAALMDIDKAKIPPHSQIYDYGPIREVEAEIKASGWKPTQ